LSAAVLVVLTWWVYAPALPGDWLWDDGRLITENPLMHEPDGFWKIWLRPQSSVEYYPLTATVERIEWSLWGMHPLGYHVVTLAVHIVNVLLVWRLFGKIGLLLAWWGALLFAIHPVQVESVAWIAELKNTLSLMFCLLAMCAWIDFDNREGGRDYFFALGFFTLAVLAKLTVVMLPVVLLLYAWWRHGGITRNDLRRCAPFFMTALAVGLVTIGSGIWQKMFGHPGSGVVPAGGVAARLVLAGSEFAFDFSKSVLPVRLLTVYPKWVVDPAAPLQYLPWLVLVGAVGWLMTRRQAWSRDALFGFGFFLVNLLPCPGFIPAPNMSYAWVMDHFLYLPILGLVGLAVAGVGVVADRLSGLPRRALLAVGVGILVSLGMESHGDAKLYRNQEALWTHTLRYNPNSDVAHNNLGLVYLGRNEYPRAIVEFEAALRVQPDYAYAHNGLGNAFVLTGRDGDAQAEYIEALRDDPDYAEAHNGLANVLMKSGDLSDARREVDRALELKPDYPEAHCNLGLLLARSGRIPEAIAQFQIAHEMRPDDARIGQILEQLRAAQTAAPTK
jgi:Tfp pilus assembly protein PilF